MENTALTPKPYNHSFFSTLKPQDCEIPNDDRFLDDNDDSKNRCCSHWLTLPPVADALKTLTINFFDYAKLLLIYGPYANLSYRNLTSLPPEVGKLTSLTTRLFLNNNQLTTLPAEIGNLSALRYLNLSGNQLISLPAEIGNLTALQELSLHNNQLISLPSEFSNLTVLSNLTLCGNPLEGFASQINIKFQMINRCLNLTHHGLSIIPPVVNKLASLTKLNLSGNQLTTVPAEIGNLTALWGLYLGKNQLTTVPAEIGNLTDLCYLDLSRNQLTTVPAEIGNLTALSSLGLADNKLTSLPSEFGNLRDLQILDLTGNPLAGLESKWAKLLRGAALKEYLSYCSTKKDLEIKTMMMLLANQLDRDSFLADLPLELVRLISRMHIDSRLG